MNNTLIRLGLSILFIGGLFLGLLLATIYMPDVPGDMIRLIFCLGITVLCLATLFAANLVDTFQGEETGQP